jgi:hypothetical protein
MSTHTGSSRDYNPDIVDLRDVIDYIREWTGSFEVGHFSTGKRYLIKTPKLSVSGDNLSEVCRRFVREASIIKAEEKRKEYEENK